MAEEMIKVRFKGNSDSGVTTERIRLKSGKDILIDSEGEMTMDEFGKLQSLGYILEPIEDKKKSSSSGSSSSS